MKFRLLGEQPLGAKGFQYDCNAMTWTSEDTQATTDSPAAPAQRPNRWMGAKGFQYDCNAMTWTSEDTQATTDSPAAPAQRPNR